MQTEPKKLSDADQRRVDKVTSTGINSVEREPFHPWRMMLWLAIVIVVFGVIARFLGKLYLP